MIQCVSVMPSIDSVISVCFVSFSCCTCCWLQIKYGPVCFIIILHGLPHGSAFSESMQRFPFAFYYHFLFPITQVPFDFVFLFLIQIVFPKVVHFESGKGIPQSPAQHEAAAAVATRVDAAG